MKFIRQWCTQFAALTLMLACALCAHAQPYPSKPIVLVVPTAPGGPTDVIARLVAAELEGKLGQHVAVENRPGVSGLIGFKYVAQAKPDGYTLVLGNVGAPLGETSTGPVPINLQKDFQPVSLIAQIPVALVVAPSIAAESVKGLLAYKGSDAGPLKYAAIDGGTASKLAGLQYKAATHSDITLVPYKGAEFALVAENAPIAFVTLGSIIGDIQTGKVRALAVSGPKRSTAAPGIPTFSEEGFSGIHAATQYALLLPAGTPPPVVTALTNALGALANSQEFRARLKGLGADVVVSTPEELATVLATSQDAARYAKLIIDGESSETKTKAASAPDEVPAPRPAATPVPSAPQLPYKVVRIFFGTDRKFNPAAIRPAEFFDGARGHAIRYGTCEVSIPRAHKTGELETPLILRRLFETPEKHVVLLRVDLRSKEHFMDDLRSAASAAKAKSALVFIHGFNNTFEDAARRTAQIAHDIEFPGVALFYSWPSNGATLSYVTDGNDADQAVVYLKTFLRDLAESSRFSSITLLAHSMGNRVLTQAFTALKGEMSAQKLSIFKEIILAAPDIDADYFRDTIAPALVASKAPITLYASSKDEALIAAKGINGGARAGDSGDGLVVVKGIETIDATNVDTNLFWGLGHAYVADSRNILSDLSYLIVKGLRAPSRFGLQPIEKSSGSQYWSFKQ